MWQRQAKICRTCSDGPVVPLPWTRRACWGGGCSERTNPQETECLKRVIISRMVLEAKSRITKKIYNEGWSGGISPRWVILLVAAPRAWCNGIGRYTLFRWAVNQDDDVWLSMRGTRHQQKCGTCGLPGESFPHGYYHLSVNHASAQLVSILGN